MNIEGSHCWLLALTLGCTPQQGDGVVQEDTALTTDILPTLQASPYIPTLIRGSFKTDQEVVARILWEGAGTGGGSPWELTPSTSHEIVVLGIPAWSDILFHLEIEVEGEILIGPTVGLQTEGPDEPVPLVSVEAGSTAGIGGYIAVPLIQDTSSGEDVPLGEADGGVLAVYDPGGRLVWSYSVRTVEPFSVRIARDGSGLYYLGFDNIGFISFDGETRTEWRSEGVHHDLIELEDGTIASLITDTFLYDGLQYEVDAIIEFDDKGRFGWVWHAADHLEELEIVPGQGASWSEASITHANTLYFDEAARKYYVNLSGIGVIAEVDRDTGISRRWISPPGAASTYTLDLEDPYTLAHRFERTESGLLWFVNTTEASACSQVVSLELDKSSGLATQQWSYSPDPCPTSFLLGAVQRIPGDSLFIDWSTAGLLEQVDEATGERQLALQSELGWAFGYGQWVPALYSGSTASE